MLCPLGDPQVDAEVTRLLAVPRDQRAPDWQAKFEAAAGNAAFLRISDAPGRGPDGFPYLFLRSPRAGETTRLTPFPELAREATDAGAGISLNPRPDGVDWVFSFGDLMDFRQTGSFSPAGAPLQAGKHVVEQRTEALVGTPSEAYLPEYARLALRRFLVAQGVKEPGVALMIHPALAPYRHLVFSCSRRDFPDEAKYQSTMRRVRWFLPRHYSVLTLPDDRSETRFVPL